MLVPAMPCSDADQTCSHLLSNQSPKLIQVNNGAVILVLKQVIVPHADLHRINSIRDLIGDRNQDTHSHLSEVSRVILVEENPMVMLASGITATTGMLAVLANATVTSTDVTALLTVLLEA